MMKTSQAGVNLIKAFEGCKLVAYKCPAGIYTIGYGHTGKDVYEGLVISEATAERLLKQDLARFEGYVFNTLKVGLTQNRFDALVSFCYNIGPGNLSRSSVVKYINENKYELAADSFIKWNKIKGKLSQGLTLRRIAERKMFVGTNTIV